MGSTATLRHTYCGIEPEPPPDPWAWQLEAACKDESIDVFFPPRGGGMAAKTAKARAICAQCTVSSQCLAMALSWPPGEDETGIFAGTSAAQRAAIRARPPVHRGPLGD
jgi:WhiB family redox-sensing transcriptional regulator